MTLTTRPTSLQANLDALGERNGSLRRRLERIEPASDIEFSETSDGVTATYRGRPLASRHQPRLEAQRLMESIDPIEHAVMVVTGFALGHHVRILAERIEKCGLIVVFEPDLALLRAVFERLDHSRWMAKTNLVWVTDPRDRGALAGALRDCETMLGLGIEFIDHPASRTRLGADAVEFSRIFKDHMASTKTNLTTTLIRSMDTIRNSVLNLDHYAAGTGITDLRDIAAGHPAVLVSAGPSLQRNIHHLARDGVRDRCVIIATQTTLRPLLEAGIRPHFVTALDYHEISKRFYEDLDPAALRDVTLVAEVKAHPVILDSFPGPVRCCQSAVLDQLLGDLQRDVGALPPGSTVAHLAMYLAAFMGCDPIVMIGQDLGFPDGLYYAPGTAIDGVWAPELNTFNTIEMMQWQRIARHRLQLSKTTDRQGKTIHFDEQMATYRNQFERDFAAYAAKGIRIIDATEGGVPKQHVDEMPLSEALDRHATRLLPELPVAPLALDEGRLESSRRRVRSVRQTINKLGQIARKTIPLLQRMLDDQHDLKRMTAHFKQMERYQAQVEQRAEAMALIGHLNQLGLFKRVKADRTLQMRHDLTPLERQRAELERDLQNVQWIEEAAREMVGQLTACERILAGESIDLRPRRIAEREGDRIDRKARSIAKLPVLIAVDPERNGLGSPRRLDAMCDGRSVLQATLERLGESETLSSIILVIPDGFDVDTLIDRTRIGLPVEIEPCEGSPFGSERAAIAASRRWSETAWRGGIAGMSIYDEVICPAIMAEIMQRRDLSAALIVGPDWPLVQVTGPQGCDALVRRHFECPEKLELVFTQAPPGLGGCVLSAALMQSLATRNRLSTIGALMVYQPHAPQHDPIARDANVQIDHSVRGSLIRATYDSPRMNSIIDRALNDNPELASESAGNIVRTLEREHLLQSGRGPRQLIIELTTRRESRGLFRDSLLGNGRWKVPDRPDMTVQTARRVFDSLPSEDEIVLTFGGLGDPLLHGEFDVILDLAREAGVASIHVRTELLVDQTALDRLLAGGIDVISVDLHADRAATYERMMGFDRFKDVLLNIEHLLKNRPALTDIEGPAGLALPWIVPRLQRRLETYEDIDSFFDRWQHMLGTAVIESPPPFEPTPDHPGDTLLKAVTPTTVMRRELRRRMVILSDGRVPVSELDVRGEETAGNICESHLHEVWAKLVAARDELERTRGADCLELRTFLP